MAKKSMKVKASREPKFEVRKYTRCNRCGRPHAVLKKYGRELAYKGQIPGMKKSSW